MRPLIHPSIEEVTVEGVLHALSDPVRVAMYADIIAQECPRSCSNFLTVSDKAIPKSTLSQHFKILREAGLIRSLLMKAASDHARFLHPTQTRSGIA